MNLSEAIAEVRTVVDDPLVDALGVATRPKFADAMIAQALERQLQHLSRIQNTTDAGFNNFTIVLSSADAFQLLQGLWQWALPPWVASISQVWFLNAGGLLSPTTQPTFSPYLWTTPPATSGDPFPKARKAQQFGWRWEGNRTFRVWGQAAAPNMLLQVAKTPARLFRATLDQDPTAKNTLYLPATLELGTFDLDEGGYINAEVQVTQAASLENVGLRRRCVYSANQNIDEARATIMYLEQNFSAQLESGDKIESVIPLGEEHCRLLVLLVAQSCFELTANLPAQKAIVSELSMQLTDFKKYVTPRDTQGPEFFQSGPVSYGPLYDSDRASPYGWGYRP